MPERTDHLAGGFEPTRREQKGTKEDEDDTEMPAGDQGQGEAAASGSGSNTKKERMPKMKPMKADKLQAAILRMILVCSLGVRELHGHASSAT